MRTCGLGSRRDARRRRLRRGCVGNMLVMIMTGMRSRPCGLVTISLCAMRRGMFAMRAGIGRLRHAANRQQAQGNCEHEAEKASHAFGSFSASRPSANPGKRQCDPGLPLAAVACAARRTRSVR